MMCVGKFMAVINVQVVATSLPTIQSADIPPELDQPELSPRELAVRFTDEENTLSQRLRFIGF
jgi:hypothetical protein